MRGTGRRCLALEEQWRAVQRTAPSASTRQIDSLTAEPTRRQYEPEAQPRQGGFAPSDEKTDLRYGELDRDARALDEDAGMTADSLRMSPWQPMEPMGPAADMGESSTEPGPAVDREFDIDAGSSETASRQADPEGSSASDSAEDNLESIDSYVQKLLARVRESAKAVDSPTVPAQEPNLPRASNPWAAKAVEDPEPEMFRRRASAVDLQKQSAGLTAMRELANLSTQIALETNNERSLRIAARIKLVIIALGILAGGLLLALGERMHAGDLPFQAALAVFAVSLACIAQYALIVVRLSLKKSKRPSAVSEKQQTVEAMQSDSPSPSIDCPPDLQTDQVSRDEESREQVAFASGGSF